MPTQRVYKRFGSIRILRDGRVRLSPRCFPDLPYIGLLARDDMIDVERAGCKVLYIWLDRGHLGSACFAYDLTPDILRKLVSEMRKAGNGLEHWIVPGLEYTQRASTLKDSNPDIYTLIPELLKTCRDLPVAKRWQQYRLQVRKEWADRLQNHPEDIANVPAPWMLPESYSTTKHQTRRAKGRGVP